MRHFRFTKESPAELQQGHGTIVVTDGAEFARSVEVRAVGVHADALESTVRDFVLEREFILTVEVVPDLDPTVLGDHEEHTLTGWRPAAVAEVGVMELGPHDGRLELVVPDLSGPITDCQEVMEHG